MLEISHAGGPREPPGDLQGQLEALGALREGPRVGQDDPLKPKKHCFQYKMLKKTMKASG